MVNRVRGERAGWQQRKQILPWKRCQQCGKLYRIPFIDIEGYIGQNAIKGILYSLRYLSLRFDRRNISVIRDIANTSIATIFSSDRASWICNRVESKEQRISGQIFSLFFLFSLKKVFDRGENSEFTIHFRESGIWTDLSITINRLPSILPW